MRWFALSLVGAVVVAVAATAATARTNIVTLTTGSTAPLATAIYDPIYRTSQGNQAFAMSSQAGATYARIDTSWRAVAPLTLPASGFDPTDPDSPYYNWSVLDATVTAAVSHGIQPILDIVGTPNWGYKAGATRTKTTGGQPDISALGAFATALAKRYDGSGPAPAVHAFSVYNEMNFNKNFYPQDPVYYRYMVNAVANAVHGVDSSNLALAGELAPYKHAATKTDKNNVIPPLTWMQQMLCVSSTSPVHATPCGVKPKFDVWTHHPYSDKGPYGHATGAGGVELGDLPKMHSLLQSAWSFGNIITESGQPPLFWITEIGWSSNPPNKHGVPMKLETRWVGESYYQLWKSGATLGTWFLLQDMPTTTPLQSGLYTISPSLSTAVAKPLLAPFTMPFVAYTRGGGKVFVWGRDATSSKRDVTIDMKVGSKWKTVAVITANDYGIFQGTLSVHALAKYSMRASAGGVTSTTFSLTKPSNENMNVVPFPLN